MTFHIVFFETNSGKTPVKDFIDNLDPKTQAKIARFLFFMPKYNIIVILHSYIKKSNKIPKNELLIATSRLKEFLRENK